MLAELIHSIYPISKPSIEALEEIASAKSLGKKEVFVEEGKPNEKEYFVLEGIVRSFVLNPQGEEISLSFFCAPSVLSPLVSRTRNNQSQV